MSASCAAGARGMELDLPVQLVDLVILRSRRR